MAINLDKQAFEKDVIDVLKKYQLNLYELNFIFEFENDILQVLVENTTGQPMSFDDLAKVNEELSQKLDSMPDVADKYILEVSSAGIERQIKTEEQLKSSIPDYVYVEFATEKKSGEFTGDLVSAEDGKYFFKYFDKGQPKKLYLAWNEIKFIRHAVNFKNI